MRGFPMRGSRGPPPAESTSLESASSEQGPTMIDGVKIKPLRVHCDERGRLMELLRSDEELFEDFGQVYVTTAYPGVIKAWHYHREQTDHFSALAGMVKIVLYDGRKSSPTHGEINEFFAGGHNTVLIKIPAQLYHGYNCIS